MRERPWLAAYASFVVVQYVYIALPGSTEWSDGDLIWVLVDALLVRAMAKGSATALTIALALTVAALAVLIVTPFVGARVNGGGLGVLMSIAIGECGCLIGLFRAESRSSHTVRPPA